MKNSRQDIWNDSHKYMEDGNLRALGIKSAIMTPLIVESNDPFGPYGAKGLGECGMVLSAAAIGNAVYNATGIRFNEIPLTPERVYKRLQENKMNTRPV
ncbi:hypothetical protein [Desulfosporosinus fructosivorans]